jgi:hypothetical protein
MRPLRSVVAHVGLVSIVAISRGQHWRMCLVVGRLSGVVGLE